MGNKTECQFSSGTSLAVMRRSRLMVPENAASTYSLVALLYLTVGKVAGIQIGNSFGDRGASTQIHSHLSIAPERLTLGCYEHGKKPDTESSLV